MAGGSEKSLHDWLLGVLAVVVSGLLVASIVGAVRLIPVMLQTANNVSWIREQMATYYTSKEAGQAHHAINQRIDRQDSAIHDLDQRVRTLETRHHEYSDGRSE